MWHTGRSERTCRLPACAVYCVQFCEILIQQFCYYSSGLIITVTSVSGYVMYSEGFSILDFSYFVQTR